MYQKDVLGHEEMGRAANAILEEASKEPSRPVSIALVDDRGDLRYFVMMSRADVLTSYIPINKAYTAARMLMDTASVQGLLQQTGWELSWFGDNKLIPLPGGVPITKTDGTVLGAIGVGGRLPEEDAELAKIGIKAIGL
ncbi:heme-binding protein [Chloroflexota bacterium]